MLIPVLTQLKKAVQKNKAYTAEKNAELAQAVSDALEEQITRAVNTSLIVSDWNNDGAANYPYYYDIAIEEITENDRADIIVLPDSMPTAQACNFCPVTETVSGRVRVRAASVPAKTINLILWI